MPRFRTVEVYPFSGWWGAPWIDGGPDGDAFEKVSRGIRDACSAVLADAGPQHTVSSLRVFADSDGGVVPTAQSRGRLSSFRRATPTGSGRASSRRPSGSRRASGLGPLGGRTRRWGRSCAADGRKSGADGCGRRLRAPDPAMAPEESVDPRPPGRRRAAARPANPMSGWPCDELPTSTESTLDLERDPRRTPSTQGDRIALLVRASTPG